MSVNQKKHQQQLIEIEYFDKALQKLIEITIKDFQSRVQQFFELLHEMFSEIQKIEANQEELRLSLKDIECRRDAVVTSLGSWKEQRDALQELRAERSLHLQVQLTALHLFLPAVLNVFCCFVTSSFLLH